MRKISQPILLIILTTQLTGCSVVILSYFRNFSDRPVEILIRSRQFKIETTKGYNHNLLFKNEILKINRKTYEKVTDSLIFNYVDSSVIRLIVPPNSTVMLTPALKLRWYDTDCYEVILKQSNISETLQFQIGNDNSYSVKDIEKKFKTTGGLFLKNIFYYDYGNVTIWDTVTQTDTVTFITIFNLSNATKGGFYLNGYIVNISNQQAKKLNGKKIKISGNVTIVKGLNNTPKEFDKNGNEIILQGRAADSKHILTPVIEIVDK